MSYNGWKNWTTWNTALWCDNEEGIYRDRMQQKPKTAEECEAFVREYFPKGTPDMVNSDPYDDQDGGRCDWHELAEHWADDYETEDAE